MKVRQVAIDVSDLAIGEELRVTFHSTYWDSLQTPEDQWVGAIGYPDSDFVRMLMVFPDNRPVKQYRLESAPNSRDKAQPFRGASLVLLNKAKTGLLWEIPKPQAGHVYRLAWDW